MWFSNVLGDLKGNIFFIPNHGGQQYFTPLTDKSYICPCNCMLVKPDFFLPRIIAWYLSGLTIILLFVKQITIMLLSDSNNLITFEKFLVQEEAFSIKLINR